jgi:hypothetical protein
MNHNHARLAGTLLSLVTCCLAMPARAQDVTTLQCPAGHWHFASVCIDSVTGDVVSAAAAQDLRAGAEAGCAPGYWRHGEVCISLASGDVEMAEARRRAASR